METMTLVAEWLKTHPYFKINMLCDQLKTDQGNFYKSYKSGKIPKKHLERIIEIISDYGFKLPETPQKKAEPVVNQHSDSPKSPETSSWDGKLIRREHPKKQLPSFLTGAKSSKS